MNHEWARGRAALALSRRTSESEESWLDSLPLVAAGPETSRDPNSRDRALGALGDDVPDAPREVALGTEIEHASVRSGDEERVDLPGVWLSSERGDEERVLLWTLGAVEPHKGSIGAPPCGLAGPSLSGGDGHLVEDEYDDEDMDLPWIDPLDPRCEYRPRLAYRPPSSFSIDAAALAAKLQAMVNERRAGFGLIVKLSPGRPSELSNARARRRPGLDAAARGAPAQLASEGAGDEDMSGLQIGPPICNCEDGAGRRDRPDEVPIARRAWTQPASADAAHSHHSRLTGMARLAATVPHIVRGLVTRRGRQQIPRSSD